MKNNLFTSRFQQKWLSIKLLATVWILSLVMVFSGKISAQTPQDSLVISAGYGTGCGSDSICCMEFTMYVLRTGTKWFRIVMQAPSWADPSCFNLGSCLTTSLTVNGAPSTTDQIVNVASSGGQISIDVATDSAGGWTSGTYVSFFLCKDPTGGVNCQQQWHTNDWWSYDDGYPNAKNPKDHNYGYDSSAYGFCGSTTPCNPACDVIEESYHNPYLTFCVTRHDWPNQADSIVVTFDPALAPCDSIRFTGDSSFRIPCNEYFLEDSAYYISGIRFDTMVNRILIPCPHADTVIQDWNSTRTTVGSVTKMVFTPRSPYYKLAPCGTWCFTIKKCGTTSRKVKIDTYPLGDTSGTCGTDTTRASFKKGHIAIFDMAGESLDEQNYPNPLTWDNNFKTTIPFILRNGGDAIIKVSDETGKIFREETRTFSDGGRHFFYFTASDLPIGKYFYQIESPKGNVIVNKSMIVVK